MNSELVLGGDYYVGDLVVGQEQRVGTIKINGITYNRYVKIVDCGALPNATTKSIAHGITGITSCEQFIGFKMMATNYAGAYNMTDIPMQTSPLRLLVTLNNIEIQVASNWSTLNGLATLEYYK